MVQTTKLLPLHSLTFLLSTILAMLCSSVCAETPFDSSPSTVKLELNNATPDWKGVRQDTYSFLFTQFGILAVLYVSPEGVSGWTDEQRESFSLGQWSDNVQNPVWDKDKWWINYILHPYWGATYYVRGHERGLNRKQAFGFSALLSTLYEFGGEALFERPSIQDLIVTPVAGAALGFWFATKRDEINNRGSNIHFGEKIFLLFSDPLGAINHRLGKVFGRNNSVPNARFLFTTDSYENLVRFKVSNIHWQIQFSMQW